MEHIKDLIKKYSPEKQKLDEELISEIEKLTISSIKENKNFFKINSCHPLFFKIEKQFNLLKEYLYTKGILLGEHQEQYYSTNDWKHYPIDNNWPTNVIIGKINPIQIYYFFSWEK